MFYTRKWDSKSYLLKKEVIINENKFFLNQKENKWNYCMVKKYENIKDNIKKNVDLKCWFVVL